MACATAALFLSLTGSDFNRLGPASTATITWLGTGTAGDTLTIGSVTMVAVAGPRTAGSNTWSVDGDEATELASFLAALSDSSLSTVVVGGVSGLELNLTTVATGPVSEIALTTSAPLVYGLSGSTFTGGSALLDFTLTTTCSMLAPLCWGAKQQAAHVYLTAHFLSIGSGTGEAGAVSSKAIDRISIGYAATSFDPSDAAFASTKWGRLYLALRSTIPSIGAVAGNTFGVIGGCGCL